MSSLRHLVNMGLRYCISNGVRLYRLEDGVIGNLADTCHLEESASHHLVHMIPGCYHSLIAVRGLDSSKIVADPLSKNTRLLRPLIWPDSPLRMQSLKSQPLKPEESASHH